jgi:hypothetical protein
MICWGIDKNLTRNISSRNPLQITCIKNLVSGLVSFTLADLVNFKFGMLMLGIGTVSVSRLVFLLQELRPATIRE